MPTDGDDKSRMAFLKKEFEASLTTISLLEKENQELKQEVIRLKGQVNTLKAHDIERKSMLWKKLQNSMDGSHGTDRSQETQTQLIEFSEQIPSMGKKKSLVEDLKETEAKKEISASLLPESDAKMERLIAVPKAPPRPNPSSLKGVYGHKVQSAAEPPLPPPPPLTSKLLVGSKAIRRVPEVMELYRSLMKRDAQRENRTNTVGILPFTNPKNMIGEIENRSTYLLSIKSDVETHGEFVSFLAREVETATFTEISEVETFVKWLDGELSCLVDERAVLKHFPHWPERKADALREAACSYRHLKNLESEVLSFKGNPKQILSQSLRTIQVLQDRLEQSVSDIERLREGNIKRYRGFHIPWKWMLDTGVIGQLKLGSLTLAKEYMQRITKELQCPESTHEEDLLLQGVRFANRVHQFAGGFDADALNAFEDLRRIGTRSCK